MSRRTVLGLLAGVLAGLGVPVLAADSLKLVAIAPVTGTLATSLQPYKMLDGMQLAVDDVNASGGLLGKQVELVVFDSQSAPLSARAAARKAAELRPLAVIGERISSLSLAIAPVLQEAKVVMISPISSHSELTAMGDYVFRMCSTDNRNAQALADFARQDLKLKRAAILVNVSQKYSQDLGRLFGAAFRAGGGEVVMEGDYLQDKADFRVLIEAVRAANADLLFVPGYVKDVAALMRQARDNGLKAPFLSGDGLGPLEEYGGPAVFGSYHLSSWQRDDPRPQSREFVQRFERRFGAVRSDAVAMAYDAVMVLADAVRRAGSADPARVRDALAHMPALAGVTGMLSFDRQRNAVRQVRIVQIGPASQTVVKIVGPDAHGSAK